jgi:2-octaprenyl-6-methoxyphenol hydroxylase
MAMQHADIAICGAGPVGLVQALQLVRRGIAPARLLLIDAKPLAKVAQDPRSIALSYGSRQILEEVGAWPFAADPIHEIHVSRRGHFGRTLIDRAEYKLPALGYVTRYGVTVDALAAAAEKAGIPSKRPAHVSSTQQWADAVELFFTEGDSLTAGIMVQAEGGVFSEQGARPVRRDYSQTAVIAHVRVDTPIAHRAFERFTDEGPLALLPQDDGYALVWCMRPENASRLQAMHAVPFLAELQQAFGNRLGRFIAISQRHTYPLGLNAHAAVSGRTVAIGNAAQTLHPVAGQGLNLGLRDATVLARLLAEEAAPASLQRFAKERAQDRGLTIRLTDTMARIFASAPAGSISQGVLGLSLGLIDAINPAKRLLAEQMMFGQR